MPSQTRPADAAAPAVTLRAGREGDIPFLARIIDMAATPPFPVSMWREVLDPVDTPTVPFLEALLAEDAFAWGRPGEFIVLQADGVPAAACAVFLPGEDRAHPVRLDRMPAVAARLGWSGDRLATFIDAWVATWQEGDEAAFTPQAGAIIEAVGVMPGFRGLGLGDRLMEAAKAAARVLGAADLGVAAILGNEGAHKLYARHFEPVVTLHPALFGGRFPGETKFRAVL